MQYVLTLTTAIVTLEYVVITATPEPNQPLKPIQKWVNADWPAEGNPPHEPSLCSPPQKHVFFFFKDYVYRITRIGRDLLRTPNYKVYILLSNIRRHH